MTLFGQAALTARRLVEAGGRFITVFWDEFGLAGTGWDTHWDHFPRMKDELLPGLDLTLSGLLIDLDRRGLLDETLVVLLSEHGRTPKLASVQGGGRDHWSRCYSVVMAGGGVARGCVVGKSDKIASDPLERRVSPKDILATIYHLLGIDPATTLTDQQGRPMALVTRGRGDRAKSWREADLEGCHGTLHRRPLAHLDARRRRTTRWRRASRSPTCSRARSRPRSCWRSAGRPGSGGST